MLISLSMIYDYQGWLNVLQPSFETHRLRQSPLKVISWDYISKSGRDGRVPNSVVYAGLEEGHLDIGSALIHSSAFFDVRREFEPIRVASSLLSDSIRSEYTTSR